MREGRDQLRRGADEGAGGDGHTRGGLHAIGGGGFGPVPAARGGASAAGTGITKQIHDSYGVRGRSVVRHCKS
ncbi:hypothetical protein NSK11_contig00029-0014 [Nocardia seriolae]|uniref:Uncharacterized protein n=1 Tax=Nocardia seriolae TaxID=37332 RepID=A0ABC9YRZ9_9NOCA|nr:hypothetical protein NSERKGN1266_72180 [Nocardia seriolae]BEK93014.1 hypothetical protein NSER024013_09200 [Nocardia seriolae]GAM46128.1 hypothetical protein NS07_v2contig00024-0014 [Nocardia seriolae]GAP28153.1 hypothetical protein NSK11_contig00029-0014 [Nocardia seriolae]GEM23859.1 hypothetical protein NS2_20980 [Nocardia seriolae NBRC 15557]